MSDASPNSQAALWRVNSELRENNQRLEREVASLREGIMRRQLTRSSAGSSSLGSQRSSLEVTGPAAAATSQEKLAALEAALEAARGDSAVAQAGIAALSDQLRSAHVTAEGLRCELGAARDTLEAAQVLLDAKESQELDLKGQVEAGRAAMLELGREVTAAGMAVQAALQRAVQAEQQQLESRRDASTQVEAAVAPPLAAAATTTPDASRPCSSTEYQHPEGAATHPQPITRVFSVVLPSAVAEEEVQALREQVHALEEQLAVTAAELDEQLAAKQEAQQLLVKEQSQRAALSRERELLQEQAVTLQQEISVYQRGSRELVAAEQQQLPIERSPSRTLTQRVKELMSPRSKVASRSGSSLSHCASSRSHPPSPGSLTAMVAADGCESPPRNSLKEGEPEGSATAWDVQRWRQQVEALQGALEAKEAQGQVHQADAAAALAKVQQQWEAEVALLKGRMAAAEAAAEAVLQQQSSPGGGLGLPEAGAASVPEECRATMQALYAQMWRERLGRQRAQAEVVEWRLKVSAQAAVVGSNLAEGGLDEAVMESLEMEMKRADHLADELKRHKARQIKLQKRAEQLELQLAEYSTLLAAAEEVDQLPRLGGSPVGGRRSPTSPVKAAITAMQMRKASEEVTALMEQLKAAQAEVTSVRRRERESVMALKATQARQRELEGQHAALASGLQTLQHLLAKKGPSLGGMTSSMSGGRPTRASTSTRRRQSSSLTFGGAMAALSALLRTFSVQGEDSPSRSHTSVMSPQGSESGAGGDSIMRMAAAQPAPVHGQDGSAAERASDPLDIGSLLPLDDCGGTSCGVMPPGGVAADRKGSGMSAGAGQDLDRTASWQSSSGRIRAVPSKQGPVPEATLHPSPSLPGSRIPVPPAASTKLASRPSGGSPGKSSRGIRKLVLGLQGSCSRLSPQATVSIGGEASSGSPARSPARKR